MEGKERYKWSQDAIVECPYEDYDYIVDTENNIIFDDDNYFKLVDLLNQQDKRIKELEEENNFLEKRNEELIIDRRDICLERNDIFEENQQLKQQLHDLPKKIVEEIEKNFTEYLPLKDKTGAGFYSRLNAILKKYGDGQ